MIRIFGTLLAVATLAPLAAQADELRTVTVDGVEISAMVSTPVRGGAIARENLLEAARTAPPASAVYHPPQNAAEAGRLNLPTR